LALTNHNNQYAFLAKGYRFYATLIFALALLAVQTLAMQHSHDGDLSHDADCSICSKYASEFEALPSDASSPDTIKQAAKIFLVFSSETSTSVPTYRSRGPPLVIS